MPPSWTTATEIASRIAVHTVASFAVSSEKSCRVTGKARKSLRKETPPKYENTSLNLTDHAYWGTPTF